MKIKTGVVSGLVATLLLFTLLAARVEASTVSFIANSTGQIFTFELTGTGFADVVDSVSNLGLTEFTSNPRNIRLRRSLYSKIHSQ